MSLEKPNPTPAEVRHSSAGTQKQIMRISEKLVKRGFELPIDSGLGTRVSKGVINSGGIHPDKPNNFGYRGNVEYTKGLQEPDYKREASYIVDLGYRGGSGAPSIKKLTRGSQGTHQEGVDRSWFDGSAIGYATESPTSHSGQRVGHDKDNDTRLTPEETRAVAADITGQIWASIAERERQEASKQKPAALD